MEALKKRKLGLAIILGLLLFNSLALSVSAWTTESTSGEWTDSTLNDISAYGDNTGRINATGVSLEPLNNTDGYRMTIALNNLTGFREWWWIAGVKRFYFAVDFESNSSGEDVYAMFNIAHEQGVVIQTSQLKVGVDQWDSGVFWNYPNVPTYDTIFQIVFFRVDETHAQVSYLIPDINDVFTLDPVHVYEAYNETFTVQSTFWDDLDAYLYVGHEGNGVLDAELGDLVLEHNLSGFETHGANPIQWIYDGLNFLFSIVSVLGSAVGAFLPVLPFFLLFYIVDVAITSVQVGSVQPVGNFVKQIIEWLSMVWGYLVEFGKLIWDIITFWT